MKILNCNKNDELQLHISGTNLTNIMLSKKKKSKEKYIHVTIPLPKIKNKQN